jgi:hypothetical protein
MAKVLVAASQPRPHREDLFRTPKWVLLAATAIVAVVILFYLHAALALWPSPSDDLFYIDAAWNLQNGTYRPPWAGAPYHHYLRWPVVLPLAALIRLFGVSQKSIAVFSILPHLGCALLLFLIFRRLALPRLASVIVLLAPFAVDPFMLAPRPLSEATCASLLLSSLLCMILPGRRLRGVQYFIAGGCMALAIDATLVALFFALTPIAFLTALHFTKSDAPRIERGTRRGASLTIPIPHRFVFPSAAYMLGLAITYGGILAAEGFLFGDPLLQFHIMEAWHLQSLPAGGFLRWLTDYTVPASFIFGFSMAFFKEYKTFLIIFSAALVLYIFARRELSTRRSATLRTLLISAVCSYLTIEVCGALAISKTYIRFVAVPTLLAASFIAATASSLIVSRKQSRAIRGVSMLVILALAYTVCLNTRKLVLDSGTTMYIRPIEQIMADLRHRNVPPASAAIITDRDGVHGAIWYALAYRVYSGYALHNGQVTTAPDGPSESTPRGRVTYFVETDGKATTPLPRGFLPLSPAGPPFVFVQQQE